MFKVGDIVKCIQGISTISGGPAIGKTYKITVIDMIYIGFNLPDYEGSPEIANGTYANWGACDFILVKNRQPPKNDIEWLDMVKENFNV